MAPVNSLSLVLKSLNKGYFNRKQGENGTTIV